MKDGNCAYCMQGELAAKFAYPICKMDFCMFLKSKAIQEG